MGQFLDLNRWKRREHFRLFRDVAHPFFSVCAEVETTRLCRKCQEPNGPSFFLAALFLALRAANETEALRLRLREQGVWLHHRVHASSTVLRLDETFAFAYFELRESFAEFQALGRAEVARAAAAHTLEARQEEDDLIYHSSLPWIRFTAFSNPLCLGGDSIPRVVFGQCTPVGKRWRMPVAVEAHHALVDGLDVARFLERFQRGLSNPLP
jgi:chloramphenicol O-acetyltransferase type A